MFYYLRRYPCNYNIIRKTLCNNRPGSNNTTIPNMNSIENCNFGSNPTIIANHY